MNHHTAIAYVILWLRPTVCLFRQELSLYFFFFPLSIQKFLDSVQAQNSRSCSWKYMHCIKKQKSLRQPASADFWVFSSYFLGYVSTFCCINLKQEVENSNICWSWLPETFKFAQLLCFFLQCGGSFLLQINALINLLKKLCLIFFSFFLTRLHF